MTPSRPTSKRLFLHDFLWFAFGVWSGALALLFLANIQGDNLGHWSGEIGIVFGAAIAAPLAAVITAAMFAVWFNVRAGGDRAYTRFTLPLFAGLLYVPVLSLSGRVVHSVLPPSLIELMGVLPFAIPFILAESAYRLQSRLGRTICDRR